ncbi:hypothetical protein SBADM41S_06618 [Streptomyces badius]
MTATTDEKLNWLLEGLLDRTPGTRHALVLSRDGLKLCRTPELSVDQADQLAAISAGIQSLSHGASIEFGDGTGGVRSAMAEFYGGVLFIVEAGAGAHLAVVADEDSDVGLVGHNMSELVEQLGEHLVALGRHSVAEAMNEVLWEDTPTQNVAGRWAARDTHLGGRHIRAGDLLLLGLAAANGDPQVRTDGSALTGGNNAFLSFGHGEHRCRSRPRRPPRSSPVPVSRSCSTGCRTWTSPSPPSSSPAARRRGCAV